MRNRLVTRLALLAISMVVSGPVLSQTATRQFNVQITIDAECQVNSASDLNFGTHGVLDADVPATSAIAVQCTNSTGYDIGLNAGNGVGATMAARRMTGGAQTVTYSLYTDAGHTDVWGDTVGSDTVAATGTGAAQTYTVYGLVPAQTTPAPGDYSDVITVTVTY